MAYPDLLERLFYHEEGMETPRADRTISVEWLEKVRGASPVDLLGAAENPRRAELVRALSFYYSGSIAEAHRIVQDATGDLSAYLHGMIHRREGDFENARYWFSRAGVQPFFGELHRQAGEFSEDVIRQPDWDPFLFCTLCERREHGSTFPIKVLVQIQKTEFTVMLDYVFRAG